MPALKLGPNAKAHKFDIIVSVPVAPKPVTTKLSSINISQYCANNPDGLMLSDEDYAAVLPQIEAMITAGLLEPLPPVVPEE